jgi:hypothetical protein
MNRLSRHSRSLASVMAMSIMASCSITAADTATADNVEGVSAPRAPVQYRVKETSLVGNDVHQTGATVSYAGLPSENLEPLCDEGRKRAAEYKESNAQRVKQMTATHGPESAGTIGDPAKFMEAFTKELAAERAEHQAQITALVEMNQTAALQLAQASANMAELAKLIASNQAAPAAAAETPAAPVADAAAGETKDGATEGATKEKRTRS